MPHKSTLLIPEARRQAIQRLIDEHGQVKVRDLAQLLFVSTMTIERDLSFLEKRGVLTRTRGGALRAPTLRGPHGETCRVCGIHNEHRNSFVIHTSDGLGIPVCCMHCGMTYLSVAGPRLGWYAVTPDVLTGRRVGVRDATFVVGSCIEPCCIPSVLCFADRTHACRFSGSFGGTVLDFDAALEEVSRHG